jgi:prepilin-type N-terminal cleavage/methylation domain-containing protein
MHTLMLKSRPGFTMAEVIVALTLTAVIGMALTGMFITQSRFFANQEQSGTARSVSRGAMNLIISELRMIELDSGLVSANTSRITVRTPYAIGAYCGVQGSEPVFSLLPADTMMLRDAGHTGYAYRTASTGRYTYVTSTRLETSSSTQAVCTTAGVRQFSNGRVLRMMTPPAAADPPLVVGTPAMVYQLISYEFKASVDVPGTIALWRTVESRNEEEELVAPFDSTARFGFFVNDAAAPVMTAPSALSQVTGIQLVLNGITEGPVGSRRVQPLTTSVFFRNR